MKSYKNTLLINSLERAIESMCCGLGTRRVKTFLNGRVKSGDNIAYLLRELLECETLNINAKRYNNTLRFDYRESYYAKKSDRLNSLLRSLAKSNPCNVVIGYDSSDVSDTSNIVYFEHELFGQISFHCDVDYDLLSVIGKFNGKWDGLVNSTLNKIENAIERQYGEVLDKKYVDIRNSYRERVRLAKMHKENVSKIVNLLSEDFYNVYNLDDFTNSEHDDASRYYSHSDKLTKFILSNLGLNVNSYLNKEEITLKLCSCDRPYLKYYVSSEIVERLRNNFRSKRINEVKSLLTDDLDNIFMLSDYSIEFHNKGYSNLKEKMKDDIISKIVERYSYDCDLKFNPSKLYEVISKRFVEDGKAYLSVYFDYDKFFDNFIQIHVNELRGLVKVLIDNDYDMTVLSNEELSTLYSVYGKCGSRHVFNKHVRKTLIPKLKLMFEKNGK